MKKIIYILFAVCLGFSSCSEDELGPSIFDTTPRDLNNLDKWIEENIRVPYNIRVNYRWEDIESNMTYNLIPADSSKSDKLVKIIDYLWIKSYDEITGSRDFMRIYAPKLIQFIGSAAINATSKTQVLGTAESGLKITLYNVNDLDMEHINIEQLNEFYFHTMHHEFAHILHQTKDYPTEYNTISSGNYSSSGWQNRSHEQAWELGFITNYASNEPREDFVEMISIYITDPAFWERMKAYPTTDLATINRKFEIVKDWLDTSWNIDIDELRDIITRRSKDIELGNVQF